MNILFIIPLIIMVTPAAYADEINPGFDLGFGFKKLGFAFQEAFTFDPIKKAELKIEHANEIDAEIQQRIESNQNIPQSMVDLQKEKLQEANDIMEQNKEDSAFQSVKTILYNAFSVADMRQIQSDFSDLVKEENPSKRMELAQALDDRINKPGIMVACFGKIDSLEISNSAKPYETLQDRCQILKLVPEDQAKTILD